MLPTSSAARSYLRSAIFDPPCRNLIRSFELDVDAAGIAPLLQHAENLLQLRQGQRVAIVQALDSVEFDNQRVWTGLLIAATHCDGHGSASDFDPDIPTFQNFDH